MWYLQQSHLKHSQKDACKVGYIANVIKLFYFQAIPKMDVQNKYVEVWLQNYNCTYF